MSKVRNKLSITVILNVLSLFIGNKELIAKESWIFETNSLALINQQITLMIEHPYINSNLSYGLDGAYAYQNTYSSQGVNAQRQIITMAPKIRWYWAYSKDFGPFLGAKIQFSKEQAKINDSMENSTAESSFLGALIFQAGIRFYSSKNWTVSAYLGGGPLLFGKSVANTIQIPTQEQNNTNWQQAQSSLGQDQASYAPDYGLTIGHKF